MWTAVNWWWDYDQRLIVYRIRCDIQTKVLGHLPLNPQEREYNKEADQISQQQMLSGMNVQTIPDSKTLWKL